jgi:hypothetical protein
MSPWKHGAGVEEEGAGISASCMMNIKVSWANMLLPVPISDRPRPSSGPIYRSLWVSTNYIDPHKNYNGNTNHTSDMKMTFPSQLLISRLDSEGCSDSDKSFAGSMYTPHVAATKQSRQEISDLTCQLLTRPKRAVAPAPNT